MKDFDPVALLRPAIRNLTPFSSARGESAELESRNDWVWLDANESPWPAFGDFGETCNANRYAEPQPKEIKSLLADLYQVAPEQLLLCRGSEEAPDLLIRSFCQPGHEGIVICPPTFGVYEVAAAINESPVRRVPLRATQGYDLDVTAILENWQPNEKLIFIPAPNAPMGHNVKDEQIEVLLKRLRGRGMVIVDQAYMEFSDGKDWTRELAVHPNLIVLRTLSKAYGIAGIRLGALIAHSDLIPMLTAVLPPYPVSTATVEIAKQVLVSEGLRLARRRCDILMRERDRLAKLLIRDPSVSYVYPSNSNFLLVQTDDAQAFIKRCLEGGIIIRNRHNDLPNTVRISIGRPEENNRLLMTLEIHYDGGDL